MMELMNITKIYDRPVLDNVSLEFVLNNIYLLKGISGSGKTTLLNIIGGIDKDFDGQYLFNKKDVEKISRKDEQKFTSKIGYIFQKSLLISHLNIMDNLLFIKNDKSMIIELSKRFNVHELLMKMPKQLSGGERQRIAIIRVLLLDPQIIIADEPTASLDYNNAIEFVEYLELLKNENKIIIIATHSDIFESISDCIINIDYGKTQIIKRNLNGLCDNNQKINNRRKLSNRQFLMNIKYSVNKSMKKFHFVSILFLIFIFFLILSAISLKFKFQTEYHNYLIREYPFNTIFISVDTYNSFSSIIEMKKYDNYRFTKDNVEYLPLLPENETILSKMNYLQKGRFPQNDFEVLINYEYVDKVLNKNGSQLNENILIKNIEFKIVGILTENETYLNDIYNSNCYYDLTHTPQVFIPYEKIKEISNNNFVESKVVMVTFDNLYSNNDLYEAIIAEGNHNYWSEKLDNFSYSLNVFLDIFFVSLGAISIILFIFIANQILLNLFYRKNEIGYLQLFGITKRRLKSILFIEYSLKYVLSLFLAIILYYICTSLINNYLLLNFVIPMKFLLLIVLAVLIYCYLVMFIPIQTFLRRSIKVLIDKYD